MLKQISDIDTFVNEKMFWKLNRSSRNEGSNLDEEVMTKFLESFKLSDCNEL